MADGELAAVFKGLAGDADQAAGNISESVAKVGEQTADNEEANLARTLDDEAQTAKSFTDIAEGEQAAPADAAPAESAAGTGPGTDATPPGDQAPPAEEPTTPNESGGDGSLRQDASNPADRAEQPIGRCGGREPVDLATGEMFLVQTDLTLAGLLPLVLERTHVSSYRSGRLFGPSWSGTLDQRLEIDEQGACYAGPDGVILVYPTPAADGAEVLPAAGARWPLRRTADGGYLITRPETGRALHFSPPVAGVAAISAISDRNGHRIEFEYAAGTLVAVRHPAYEVRVDVADGLVTGLRLWHAEDDTHTDLVQFAYDERRRLTGVTNSSQLTLRFDYDPAGRITRWTDRNGQWYGYHYDAAGRCVRTEGSGNALAGEIEYAPAERITVETDSLGHRTVHHFDDRNKLVRRIDALGAETRQDWTPAGKLRARTDALGNTTRYTYDEHGDMVDVTRPDGTRLLAEYGPLRQVTTMVGADGAVWRRAYDDRGNLLAVTDPAGGRVRYAYDERGHLTSITDQDGATRTVRTDAAGLPVAVTDPHGGTTAYQRDAFGRVALVTDPNGNTTRYGWTVEGHITVRTRPDGATEHWRYDGEGNQIEHVDPSGRRTRTSVTHLDRPAAVTDAAGRTHEFGYDSELRITSVRDPRGLLWRYDYDPVGNLIREVDFDGRELTYRHDAAGRLISRTNNAGQTVHFGHDRLGNVVERRGDDGSRSTFEFDPAGRMTKAVNNDSVVVFERDARGAVIAETINGRTVHTGYDASGRPRYRRTPSGLETWWDYDRAGRPSAMRTAGRALGFHYDPAGRETERRLDAGAVLSQEWDAADRLIGQTIAGARNAGTPPERLVQRRRYGYHADGSLRSADDHWSGPRELGLDPVGRVVSVTGPDRDERYDYDPAGNPTTVIDARPGNGAGVPARGAGAVRYGYDAQGRVTTRSRNRLSAKPDVWHYEWDAEDRLVGIRTPDGARWRYQYDALGRRISKLRLGPDDATRVEQLDFAWDGPRLAEQSHSHGAVTSWDYTPGTFRAVSQVERVADAQHRVDQRFYAIVTDLVGTPAELVDPGGNLAWHGTATLWGAELADRRNSAATPLRFPGQYHDAESELHYNYQRFYDPETGSYQSVDPLGLAAGPNPRGYVPNPTTQIDPLGLSGCEPHLFRGTSEGYPGSPNMERIGVTPTSTDPAVATAFATESEQFGNGIVHIASPDDVAGVERLPPSLGSLEDEVPLDMKPSEFAQRASTTIPVSQARQILSDMGVSVPSQIVGKGQLDAWLHMRTPMTDSQIGEFVRRATGG